jgi:hypothetical protein
MPEETVETIEEAITSVATGMVKRIEENGREVEMLPLKEIIEADRYISAKTAASKPHFGLRLTRCVPPGGG